MINCVVLAVLNNYCYCFRGVVLFGVRFDLFGLVSFGGLRVDFRLGRFVG